jgi:23S rRNA pseudouridine2605 synthase
MVGRLDVNTSGLLVFSNNGDLVQKLSHPSSMIERKYLCRIFGKPTTSQIQNLLNGALIDGKKSSFDKLTPIKKQSDAMNNWFRVTLHSGRNREVRKLWESQSIQVNRLIRIGFGPIALPENLKKGQYRYLTENEIDNLLKLLELEN